MNRGDITALFVMLGCIVGLLIKITLEIQGRKEKRWRYIADTKGKTESVAIASIIK